MQNKMSKSYFANFSNPLEIIIWYDGPLLFTTLSKYDDLLVFYQYKDNYELSTLQYVVKTTNINEINSLKNNEICMRHFLDGPIWLIEVDYEENINNIIECNLNDLEHSTLPEYGVFLNFEKKNKNSIIDFIFALIFMLILSVILSAVILFALSFFMPLTFKICEICYINTITFMLWMIAINITT